MVNISDAFIGTKQSRFAGMAIFIAIIIVCISILFNNTDISIGQRLSIVLFIILTSIPSILLSLFELTCIVTGGNSKRFQWCHYFAWFVAAIIIVYCAIIIISVILSMFTYNSAMDKVKDNEVNNKVSKDDANKIAKTMISSDKSEMPNDMKPTVVQTPPPKQIVQEQKPATMPPSAMNYDHPLSISPSPVGNMDMNNMGGMMMNNGLEGFDSSSSLSEWKPMNNMPPMNIKPIINSSANLGTTSDGNIPSPYMNENFSLF